MVSKSFLDRPDLINSLKCTMSLVIRNLQNIVRVNEKLLFNNSRLIRKFAGFEEYDLGIMLVDDTEITKLNKQYLGNDEVTDVLAFPYHEISVEDAGCIPAVSEEEKMLGDIVLGMPYIRKQSWTHGTDLMDDVMTHITHGLCHLVGFDHETASSWLAMQNKELHILEQFNQETGHNCVSLLQVGHYSKDS